MAVRQCRFCARAVSVRTQAHVAGQIETATGKKVRALMHLQIKLSARPKTSNPKFQVAQHIWSDASSLGQGYRERLLQRYRERLLQRYRERFKMEIGIGGLEWASLATRHLHAFFPQSHFQQKFNVNYEKKCRGGWEVIDQYPLSSAAWCEMSDLRAGKQPKAALIVLGLNVNKAQVVIPRDDFLMAGLRREDEANARVPEDIFNACFVVD
jgi:hypothetical protein